MPDDFNFPAYASGNPVISQLFANEFALRQGNQAALQAQAARDTARAQIAAQSRLAESQLRGQQQADLFRMQQSADNNRLASRQLDIDEEYKKGILSRQPVGTQVDAERRKAAIIDANSNAVNDAARANALLKIAMDSEIAAEKGKVGAFGNFFSGPSVSQIDDPQSTWRKALNKRVFDGVYAKLVAEKGGTVQSIIPDADTFTFRPVQFDETGKAIALPLPTPAAGAGAAAGLGTTPSVSTGAGAANPAALGPMAPETQAVAGLVQPVVNNMLSSAADMFKMNAPTASVAPVASVATPSVKRLLGSATVLLTPEDDAELQRQLVAIVPEQRPAAYRAIVDGLLKSQRAVLQSLATGNFEIPSAMY